MFRLRGCFTAQWRVLNTAAVHSRNRPANRTVKSLASASELMFPKPEGPFRVGLLDVQLDLDPNSTASPIKDDQQAPERSPDPSKHLVGRLFYPTDSTSKPDSLQYIIHRNYATGFAYYATVAFTQWWTGALRSIFTAVIYASTLFERIPVHTAAPLAASNEKLPVVVYSHGMGGNKLIYSYFLSHLASMGFIVMAIEHTDGLSSAARLAGKRGWLYFKRWPRGQTDFGDRCVEHRIAEVQHAVRAMHSINAQGASVEALSTFDKRRAGAAALDSLQGRLDMSSLVLSGHSFGGATIAGVAPEVPEAVCCVLQDPWWPGMPKSRRTALQTSAPLCPMFVLGSSAFNRRRQDADGLVCEGQAPGLQDDAMNAFTGQCDSQRASNGNTSGSREGTMLVVPNQSHHTMVDDVGAIFKDKYAWLFKFLTAGRKGWGLQGPATKDAGFDLADRCSDAVLAYLDHQLRLPDVMHTGIQQRLQRYCGPPGHGKQGAGVPESLSEWQQLIFSGGAYNGNDAENGLDSLKVYAPARSSTKEEAGLARV